MEHTFTITTADTIVQIKATGRVVNCCCDLCYPALIEFYIGYLADVKKFTCSEVNEKTQSQRRVIEFGKRLVYAFSDTLFGSDKSIRATRDGDDLVDIWNVARECNFCQACLESWECEMVDRGFIRKEKQAC
jgi:hypothetical protein